MGFFDNIGKTLSEAGQGAIQKGKEMADVAKYKSLISDEEKKITNVYEQIGKKYVEEYGDSPSEIFIEYFNEIKASNEKIADYQQKLKEVKGVVKCPSCGAEVPNGSQFCGTCGARVEEKSDVSEENECSNAESIVSNDTENNNAENSVSNGTENNNAENIVSNDTENNGGE